MYERRTMMKKLLVLTLVLGIASLANAGFSLAADGTTVTMVGADNDTYAGTTFNLICVDSATTTTPTINYNGGVAPSTITANMGFAANWEAYIGLPAGSVKSVWVIELADSAEPYELLNGTLVTANMAGAGTVYLRTAAGAAIDSITVVPEPATLALLGLGALVLRRKK
jgi:hypothetical protein